MRIKGLRERFTLPFGVLLDLERRRQFGLTHSEGIPAARNRTSEVLR